MNKQFFMVDRKIQLLVKNWAP